MKIISPKWFIAVLLLLSLQILSIHQVHAMPSTTNAVAEFDESEIYNHFAEVEGLVNAIATNDAITYNDLAREKPELLTQVSSATTTFSSDEGKSLLIVPAFFYGCMFTALGVLVVAYVSENNPVLVRQAATGCIITSVAVPVLYAFVYGIYIASM